MADHRRVGKALAALAFLALVSVSPFFAAAPPTQAASDLLKRLVGERGKDFVLEELSAGTHADAYEVEARRGRVVVRGNTPVAIARGVYDYLRHACNCQVTWSGRHLDLPVVLPEYTSGRVVCPHQFRLYFNVCAFGYTTAFWNWPRWEQELDWMALHGINMPMALAGQEAIWQKIWKDLGITDRELAEYFTGPAFLPWHRMGNVNKHDGPLPEGWLDGQRGLQKKILERMRELGMTPVVPAFSGFVPKALSRIYPQAGIRRLDPWGGFGEEYNTYILSPSSPLFEEIGRRFIQAYKEEYGPVQYYLADSFNELRVPVSEEKRYEELADYGESVYRSILAGDPDGIWVMQGWLFYNDRSFWDHRSVQALLSRVPNDRMIIIDLANEMYQGWKDHAGFYGKKWIYSIIHNFGGNNPLGGDLAFCAGNPAAVRSDTSRGAQVGFGMSPEGIENNEVVYELLTDAAWSAAPIDLPTWMVHYCVSRYGASPEGVRKAWDILLATVYRRFATTTHFGFQARPALTPAGPVQHDRSVGDAARSFLSSSGELGKNQLYLNDLIEIVIQYAGLSVDRLLSLAGTLHRYGQTSERDVVFGEASRLMTQMDELLGSRPDRRLSRWTASARAWAKDASEEAYYESDAKRQVTVWGGPELSEYASKLWSGLVGDYYAKRWALFYDSLHTGRRMNLDAWEESWIMSPEPASPPKAARDPVAASRGLVASIDSSERLFSLLKTMPSMTRGGSKPGLAARVYYGSWDKVPELGTLQPASRQITQGFDIGIAGKEEDFAVSFEGYVSIPAPGVYTFWTVSDDGSVLRIGDTPVVDNDGLHAPEEREGAVAMEKGYYPISVSYFQRKGAKTLQVLYSGPGIPKQAIPGEVLSRREN
jgi:alpha-N-acetylglucosaminidase